MSPIYTMFIAAIVLKEPLSWQKVLAALMVFTGVFIVSRSRAAGNSAPHDGVYQRPQDFLGLRFALSVTRKPLAINRLDD